MINPRAKCKIIDKHDPVNDEMKKKETLVTTQSFLLSIVSPINISLAAGDNSKKKKPLAMTENPIFLFLQSRCTYL